MMFSLTNGVPAWFYALAIAVVIAFIIIAEWKTRK